MKGKMKAQVFYETEKMQLEDVDIPEISPVEVLVKVKYVVSYCLIFLPLRKTGNSGKKL